MTEKKRFEYKNHKVFDNLTGEEHSSNMVSVNILNQLARVNREGVKKVQKLAKENKQLKEELADANELKRIYVDFLVDKGFELSDVVEWSKKVMIE